MRQITAIARLLGIATLILCLAEVSPLCASPMVQSSEISGTQILHPIQSLTGRLDPERVFERALELRAKFTRKELSDSISMLGRSARMFRVSANSRGEALVEIEAGDT